MKQLKMFWKRQKPNEVALLDGYSIRRFNDSDTDINHWLEK